MTQVCTSAWGHVASIASGSPFRPSQHTISASFQASVAYLGQMPTASIWRLRRLRRAIPPARVYSPSTSTPTTTYAGRLMTVPLVLDLDHHGIYVHKWDNTRQGAGSTQSVSSSRIPSVTLDTNAGDTSTPYMRFRFQTDVTGGQATSVQGHDVGVEPFQAPGALGNDSGFERGVTVSGHIQIHRADL